MAMESEGNVSKNTAELNAHLDKLSKLSETIRKYSEATGRNVDPETRMRCIREYTKHFDAAVAGVEEGIKENGDNWSFVPTSRLIDNANSVLDAVTKSKNIQETVATDQIHKSFANALVLLVFHLNPDYRSKTEYMPFFNKMLAVVRKMPPERKEKNYKKLLGALGRIYENQPMEFKELEFDDYRNIVEELSKDKEVVGHPAFTSLVRSVHRQGTFATSINKFLRSESGKLLDEGRITEFEKGKIHILYTNTIPERKEYIEHLEKTRAGLPKGDAYERLGNIIKVLRYQNSIYSPDKKQKVPDDLEIKKIVGYQPTEMKNRVLRDILADDDVAHSHMRSFIRERSPDDLKILLNYIARDGLITKDERQKLGEQISDHRYNDAYRLLNKGWARGHEFNLRDYELPNQSHERIPRGFASEVVGNVGTYLAERHKQADERMSELEDSARNILEKNGLLPKNVRQRALNEGNPDATFGNRPLMIPREAVRPLRLPATSTMLYLPTNRTGHFYLLDHPLRGQASAKEVPATELPFRNQNQMRKAILDHHFAQR
ncbi:MAG: hypothetical protein WCX64_03765 [Candidatus Micrarchaeia archaeon]